MRSKRGRGAWRPGILSWMGVCGLLVGCASPGTPRPPSLQLPEVVRDLRAMRSGDVVELRFSVPSRTTDGVAIRSATVQGVLCRQEDKAGACAVVDTEETAAPLPVPSAGAAANEVVWKDRLPVGLTAGAARVISYRVQLRNELGKSAGYSDAAYAAAGGAPPAVDGFAAEGARPGVLLRWNTAPGAAGEVRVRRERLDGVTAGRTGGRKGVEGASREKLKAAGQGVGRRGRGAGGSENRAEDGAVVWLRAPEGSGGGTEMVDGSVEEGVRYRYSAVRWKEERVGGRMLEVRSAPSAEVEITWRDVYPPVAPEGLTALGYGAGGGYAVDLVWQPVGDPRVTGYQVTRQRLDGAGQASGAAERLTAEPVSTPGFHDATALAGETYRYEVVAVDAKGNASAPAVAVVKAAGGV